MPGLRKHEPVPDAVMQIVSHECSICETLRQIYQATEDEYIRKLARLATAQAKAMSSKLAFYHGEKWWKGFCDDNSKPS